MKTDFGGDTDKVYPALEDSEKHLEGDLARHSSADGSVGNAHKPAQGWAVPPDSERKPRSAEEMQKEAQWLERLLAAA